MNRLALLRVDPGATFPGTQSRLGTASRALIDGVTVSSILNGMGVTLGLTGINTLPSSLLDNRFCNPDTNKVAAFEELLGSHGGFGGYRSQPFVLYPAEWDAGQDEIVGAEASHRILKGWVDQFAQT